MLPKVGIICGLVVIIAGQVGIALLTKHRIHIDFTTDYHYGVVSRYLLVA